MRGNRPMAPSLRPSRVAGLYCRVDCAEAADAPGPVSALAAEASELDPCPRCRPDLAPWPDAPGRDAALAALLAGEGLQAAERNLLTALFGAPPRALRAALNRLQWARCLVEGDLQPAELQRRLRPTAARRASRLANLRDGRWRRRWPLRLWCPATPDFDGAGALAFYRRRQVPGLEHVDHRVMCRALEVDGARWLLTFEPRSAGVLLHLEGRGRLPLARALALTRGLFDLEAPGAEIDACLAEDPRLVAAVKARPALRLPGAADPFEIAVRAVLGQQVSVEAARTLTRRLLDRLDACPVEDLAPFPAPARLASADLADLGVPGARARALTLLARLVEQGELDFAAPGDALRRMLCAVPGIGPWTAEYVAMRGLGDRDALPAADLVLRKRLGAAGAPLDPRRVLAIAEAWRPWRAHGLLHVWRSLSDPV